MSHILITRPNPDGQILAAELEEFLFPQKMSGKLHKNVVVSEPMLTIHPLVKKLKLKPEITDLIVTSSRVFSLIENIQDYIDKPIWCVGDVTAEAAKSVGFKTIICAQRSAQDLLSKIVEARKDNKASHHFVHIGGDTLHLDLAEALTKEGFQADRVIAYRILPAKEFSQQLITLIKDKKITLASFFSKRTAEVFVELAKKHQLNSDCKTIIALAHSEEIQKALDVMPWAKIDIVPNLGLQTIAEKYSEQTKHLLPVKPVLPKSHPSITSQNNLKKILLISGVGLLGGLVLILLMNRPQQYKTPIPTTSEKTTLNPLETQLANLQTQINTLTQRLETLERTSQTKIDSLKNQLSSQLQEQIDLKIKETPQTKAPDFSAFIEYQGLIQASQHFSTSTLFKEDEDLLYKLGILKPGTKVLSFSQLLNSLSSLNLETYEEVNLEEGGLTGLAHDVIEKLGIKVRRKDQTQTESHTLKESIQTDLQNSRFNFIPALDKMIQNHPKMSPSVRQWLAQAKQSQTVFTSIKTRLDEMKEKFNPLDQTNALPSPSGSQS